MELMKMMIHYFVKQKDAMLLSFTFFLNQYGLAKLCTISFFFPLFILLSFLVRANAYYHYK